jgi:hypothetical protein
MAAGIVGAGTGLLTKDLNKGLLAGLGAFGGASLAGSLMGAGSAAGSSAAAAETAAAAGSLYTPAEIASMQAAGLSPAEIAASAADYVGGASGVGTANMPFSQATQSALNNPAMAGLSEISKAPGAFFKKNMFPIGAAAAPLLLGGGDLFGGGQKEDPATSSTYIRPQTYTQTRNPNYTGAGTPYFTQSYAAKEPVLASEWGNRSFAGGGIVALADGGQSASLGISALGPQLNTNDFAPVVTYDPVTKQYVNANSVVAPVVDNNFTYDPVTQRYITATPEVAAGLPAIGTDMTGPQWYAGDSGEGGSAGPDGPAGEGDSPGDSSDGGVGDAGFASGGITNSKMAQVEQYLAKAQSSTQGMQEVMSLAKAGDYNAAIALNKIGGNPNQNYAMGGGISSLGSYSDGGRMLKGPGDGVSDSIPATIGGRQPARLAAEEFVIPARIVSELGNGSSEAGAKRLYGMMERVEHAREKSVGNGKIAVDTKAYKHLPA